MFSAFTTSTAFISVSYLGFGSIPENSNISLLPKMLFTLSISPLLFALPPPYVISTFASTGTFSLIDSNLSLPK